MNQEKKPDFVLTADGELVPTDEVPSAEVPAKKIALPAFPKSPPPAPAAKAKPAPPPPPPVAIAAPAPRPLTPKRPPPPLPPLDPREMVEERIWTGERTRPDPSPSRGANALARLAMEEGLEVIEPISSFPPVDDLALPAAPAPAARKQWDEDLSSPAEVEKLIRHENYRSVMEQVADIDGDESLDAEPPPPALPPARQPPPQQVQPSQDIPVIRGTAVAPPPRVTGMRPSVTGTSPPAEEPAPRRGPQRVGTNRVIKEKNRPR